METSGEMQGMQVKFTIGQADQPYSDPQFFQKVPQMRQRLARVTDCHTLISQHVLHGCCRGIQLGLGAIKCQGILVQNHSLSLLGPFGLGPCLIQWLPSLGNLPFFLMGQNIQTC